MNTATEIVAPRMQALQKLEKTLKKLDLSWKVIETTARVVSPPQVAGYIATLEHTRLAFSQLAAEMVEQIALTHLENCRHELASKAQVAIDILVRNLFERTADVGFIATDGPLVNFVMAPDSSAQSSMHARLNEYRAKYTVYDDILVLDASAQILLSLKPRSAERTWAPSWWSQAQSIQGYVEHFGPSELFKNLGSVLLYAHRILAPDGSVCGAVVLKFDLQSELASIFGALQDKNTVLLMLDGHARVVASSEPARIAVKEEMPMLKSGMAKGVAGNGQTLRHQSVDYLYAHCHTRGYQGYAGPGWTAVALVGQDEAFETMQGGEPQQAAQGFAEIELDNQQLHRIIARARSIEEDLNRVIWNGKLTESGAGSGSALSPVFAEIGRTSKQTIAVFDDAILELKQLLMAGRRADLAANASLAADIMDRNLYERANDCRWWALSEEFAVLLQQLQGGADEAATARAAEILAHLNSLYTVYRRVALFDRQGHILAVSKDPETMDRDATIPAALLQRTLGLKGSQAYAVSEMVPHALTDGAATYLYCAPIRQAGAEHCLGGIALAFNCADELKAMLKDSLPVGTEAMGFFMDPQGRVLSSTLEAVAVGDSPDFMQQLLAADPANGLLCEWEGRSYLAGMAHSKGYREFKITDGYRDDVQSVLLTAVELSPQQVPQPALPQRRSDSSANAFHFGVVQCGRLMFGLGSEHVIEAVAATHLSAPPVASESVGMLEYKLDGKSAILAVYDACKLTGQKPIAEPRKAVAIIVRRADQNIALLVDRLIDVIASDPTAEPPGGINAQAPWISGYIHDSQAGTEPIFTIDPQGLNVMGLAQAPAEATATA